MCLKKVLLFKQINDFVHIENYVYHLCVYVCKSHILFLCQNIHFRDRFRFVLVSIFIPWFAIHFIFKNLLFSTK